MESHLLSKGDILTEPELDHAVYRLIKEAQQRGMIPIAGIVSELVSNRRHRVLGFGWNRLREGIVGIHGETGAIMSAGRLAQGYDRLVVTSSLNPCEFCQRLMMNHLGVRRVRILDDQNLCCDWSIYREAGAELDVVPHRGVIRLFGRWQADSANQNTWARDIGDLPKKIRVAGRPFDLSHDSDARKRAVKLVVELSDRGQANPEAPIGAAVLDQFGEVIGAGHGMIVRNNDPSAVAAMAAWRACGAREHWRDKTLVITGGLDEIAYSMFAVFRFGQLMLVGKPMVGNQLIARLKCPIVRVRGEVHLNTELTEWSRRHPDIAREYFGMASAL